jgi:hypothetical protein
VLTPKELKAVINNSRLFYKYNENLDRESAYELLNSKIDKINKAEEKAIQDATAKKEKERIAKEKERSSRKRTSSRSRSSRQDPLVKVLTSATFIRAVFGILKKVIK